METDTKPGLYISLEEIEVWNLIKKYPDELGFVLQEKDYDAYVDTFGASDAVPLTEAQFNLIKHFFQSIGVHYEGSN